MTVKRVGKKLTNFPWAIVDDKGNPSQARFESKEAANIALRNYSIMGGK